MKKLSLFVVCCLLFISFNSFATSEVREVKNLVEDEMDEIVEIIEDECEEFYFDEDELDDIEVGEPIACYTLKDSNDNIEDRLKQNEFYVVPLMYDGEPRLDASVCYIEKKDRWEVLDIGGNVCVTVKDLEERCNLSDMKIVDYKTRVIMGENEDGELLSYLPYSCENKKRSRRSIKENILIEENDLEEALEDNDFYGIEVNQDRDEFIEEIEEYIESTEE